jgi:hypothetical protein
MDKFSVDISDMTYDILKKKAYRLSDVQDRIERVAFDVVRFRDNKDTDMLWKIQETSEGPVIVALYDEENSDLPSITASVSSKKNDWEVLSDKIANSVDIFYHGEPVIKIKASDVPEMSKEDFSAMPRWLPNKLAEDESFQSIILKKMASANREVFVSKHPELRKVASI